MAEKQSRRWGDLRMIWKKLSEQPNGRSVAVRFTLWQTVLEGWVTLVYRIAAHMRVKSFLKFGVDSHDT